MIWRVMALVVIYLVVSAGWYLLAENMDRRSLEQDDKLAPVVGRMWGGQQIQDAPQAFYLSQVERVVPHQVGDHVYGERVRESRPIAIPLQGSDVDVNLALEHRRKGLLWYPTYRVRFRATYRLANSGAQAQRAIFQFPLPAPGAVYDDFLVFIGDQAVEQLPIQNNRIKLPLELSPGQDQSITVAYQSQGLGDWLYRFGDQVSQVRNFRLGLKTDFGDIDFPEGSLSPTDKERQGQGWSLNWQYTNLLSGVELGMVMPEKLNPGPWVTRVTRFAPVSLGFFFFLLFIICVLRRISLHPMNYFFLGAAFFSFHLLLAYLVDHISIHLAFWIAAAVSLVLVISYMRLVVGGRFALVEVGLSQLVYLVGFAYTFFFEGATGLAVAIMSVVVLFVVMQFTGRLRWEKVFCESPGLTRGGSLVKGER